MEKEVDNALSTIHQRVNGVSFFCEMCSSRDISSWEKPNNLSLLGHAVIMCLLVCSHQLVSQLRLECL